MTNPQSLELTPQQRAHIARQRAAYAQTGVLIDTMSPLQELADRAAAEELAFIKAGGILPAPPQAPEAHSVFRSGIPFDPNTPTEELVEQILGNIMPEELELEKMEQDAKRADADKRN